MTETEKRFVLKGSRVRITTDLGEFEGTVASYDVEIGIISVKNVTCANNGNSLPKMMNFMKNEIIKLDILSLPKKKIVTNSQNHETRAVQTNSPQTVEVSLPNGVNKTSKVAFESLPADKKVSEVKNDGKMSTNEENIDKLLAEKSSNVHAQLSRLKDFVLSEQTLLGGISSRYTQVLSVCGDESERFPNNYLILERFCEGFCLALNWIKSVNVIGLTMDGKNLGRNGQLGWISICARRQVFLFDVLSLGEKNLMSHLRTVFENENIIKVVHDCREISDLLFHRHEIKFVNVFDTQVASVIVSQRKRGFLPTSVDSLVVCLFENLNLPQETIYVQKELALKFKNNPDVWIQRPAPENVLQAIVFCVRYLNELRLRLMEEMMRDLIDGVDIYLGIFRDAEDKELDTLQNMTHMLPREFKNLEVNAEASRKRTEELFSKDTSLSGVFCSAPTVDKFVADCQPKRDYTLVEENALLDRGAKTPRQSSMPNLQTAAQNQDKEKSSSSESLSMYDILKLRQPTLTKCEDVVFLAAGSEPTVAVANERPKKLKAKLAPSTDDESDWYRNGKSLLPSNPRHIDVFEDFSAIPSPERFRIGHCAMDSYAHSDGDCTSKVNYASKVPSKGPVNLEVSRNSGISASSSGLPKTDTGVLIADKSKMDCLSENGRISSGVQKFSGPLVNSGALARSSDSDSLSETSLEIGNLLESSFENSKRSGNFVGSSNVTDGTRCAKSSYSNGLALQSIQDSCISVNTEPREGRLPQVFSDTETLVPRHTVNVPSIGRGVAMLKLMQMLEDPRPGQNPVKDLDRRS